MTATVNIYSLPKVLTLTLGGATGAALMNYPANTTDFTLAKGITNEILFFVKDTDRHPVTAANLSNLGIVDLRMIITDSDTGQLLLGSQTPAFYVNTVTNTYVYASNTNTDYTTNIVSTITVYSNTVTIVSNSYVSNNTANSGGGDSNSVSNSNTVSNTPIVISNTGAGIYEVPDTVNAITVETWGPGGAGVLTNLSGAGGGAYALKNYSVNPGDTFDYYVGTSNAIAEQPTYWGNTNWLYADFGAYGGANVMNNVSDISIMFSAPFGSYDVGYYGNSPVTNDGNGQAAAWSGGNANTNPAALNESSPEGGGEASVGNSATTPGGGAPANQFMNAEITTLLGGPGQIRITQYVANTANNAGGDTGNSTSNSNSNANSNSNSNSGSNTSNSNSFSNTIIFTNSTTTSVVYTSNAVWSDPSVLIPAPGIDPTKGAWLLRLAASDVANWPLGYLQYSVVCDRIGGDQVMLYTDRNFGYVGGAQLVSGPFPFPPEATIIEARDFTFKTPKTVYTGSLPGAASVANLSGQMSLVVQMHGFAGSVTIQGSLENQPDAQESDWFIVDVDPTTLTNNATVDPNSGGVFYSDEVYGACGPSYIAFSGNYMWVRFIIHTSNGSFSQVAYRND